MIYIVLLCALGFLVSLYMIYVEDRLKRDRHYRPACDIHDRVSCSKAALSRYGTLFSLPNSVLGVVFYASVAFFAFFRLPAFIMVFSGIGLLFSLYLAFVSFFVQKNVCVLCISAYAINILLFYTAFFVI